MKILVVGDLQRSGIRSRLESPGGYAWVLSHILKAPKLGPSFNEKRCLTSPKSNLQHPHKSSPKSLFSLAWQAKSSFSFSKSQYMNFPLPKTNSKFAPENRAFAHPKGKGWSSSRTIFHGRDGVSFRECKP